MHTLGKIKSFEMSADKTDGFTDGSVCLVVKTGILTNGLPRRTKEVNPPNDGID